jgi:hypothetical protein
MAIQMAVFAFGSLLMLVAILGGGFEVKELKVPKVGRASRLAACACGMLFIFLGIHLDRPAAPAAAAPQPQKGTDVASAALPQIVLVSALAGQPALRVDKIAEPAAPQQLSASTAESRREVEKTPEPATTQQVRASKANSEQHGQATASSSAASKRVPWEQKPRQWINRLRGKGAAR